MSRPVHRRAAALAAILLLGWATSSRAGRAQPPAPFEPDSESKGAPPIDGETWRGEGAGYAVRLTRIDADARRDFFRSHAGLDIDPFASRPDQPPGFLSFLLEVDNTGGGALRFQPLRSWLVTNRRKVLTPLGTSDLSFAFRTAGRDWPAGFDRVGSTLLWESRTVAAGDSLAGLLVYRAPEPRTKSFRVEIRLTLPDGENARFEAPYRRSRDPRRGREP